MISRPEDVTQTQAGDETYTWDGTSIDLNSGRTVSNKETAMDWAEHQRIVFNARTLLASDISHTGDVKKAFKALQSAFNDTNSRTEVRVSKGIHQPLTNPHLQLRTLSTFKGESGAISNSVVHKFHLNVSAVDTPELADRFQWVGVQFSYLHNGNTFRWPIVAGVSQVKRERRASISFASLAAYIEKQNEAQAAAEKLALEQKATEAFSKACSDFEKKFGIKIGSKNAFRNGKAGYNRLPSGSELRYRFDPAKGVIDLL